MSYFHTVDAKQRYFEAKKATGKALHRRAEEKYKLNPSYCKQCDKILSYDKRNNIFCNSACSASFNNKGVRRHGKNPATSCEWCGLITYSRKWCSNQCQRDQYYYTYINKWFIGAVNGGSAEKISNHIRRYLFEKYDNRCSICKWGKKNSFTDKSPLEIDHIDGDASNNRPTNLTLLCPNCHSLTPTHKSLNRGNGRSLRRKRYIKGISINDKHE